MPYFDLPLEKLQEYKPERVEPIGFDLFWQESLTTAREFPTKVSLEEGDYGLRLLDTYDLTFNGYGGQPIKGWLILPKKRNSPLPCVVQYIGYGGGRSLPYDWLLYPSAGFACLVMDTRGQGSSWSMGDTPDIESEVGNPQFPGVMTRGILKPETYYYRRLYIDAVRAVDAARSCLEIDSQRIAVRGHSQGGGLAMVVAALEPTIQAALVGEPFLCHFRRATEITETAPYSEIVSFCRTHRDKVDVVFNTLSYFDGVNFAARAKVPALFSVGLMDDVCPPSTVFAAYNHYLGTKSIQVYAYNQHDGGGEHQDRINLKFLHEIWGS